MEASVEIDIVCHLGFATSIDVREKGFYYIEMSLQYGSDAEKTDITPVGCFSAPSTLNSRVKRMTINPTKLLRVSSIDEDTKAFSGRSFMIRYKDETHELNDGCHWRLTIPQVLVSATNRKGRKSMEFDMQDLLLQFKLHYCYLPSKEVQDGDLDEVEWIQISEQVLQLQNIARGIHDYFPVHFSRSRYFTVDCMVHGAVTGVRYAQVFCGDLPVSWKDPTATQNIMVIRDNYVDTVHEKSRRNKSTSGCDHAADGIDKSICSAENNNEELLKRMSIAGNSIPSSESTEGNPSSDNNKLESLKEPTTPTRKGEIQPPRKSYSPTKTVDTSSSKKSEISTAALYLEIEDNIDEDEMNVLIRVTSPAHNRAVVALPLNDSHSPTHKSMTTVVQRTSAATTPVKRKSFILGSSQSGSPSKEKSIEKEMEPSHSRARARSINDSFKDFYSNFSEVKSLWQIHVNPVVINYYNVIENVNLVLSRFTEPINFIPHDNCCLEIDSSLSDELQTVATSQQFEQLLFQKIDKCNLYLASRWALFLSNLPQSMSFILRKLRPLYETNIRRFWKKQLFVHTCGLEYSIVSPVAGSSMDFIASTSQNWFNSWKTCGDEELLNYLCQYIESVSKGNGGFSHVNANSSPTSTLKGREIQGSRDSLSHSSAALSSSDCDWCTAKYAYNMNVFDANVHREIKKLPIILLQQYISPSLSESPLYPNDKILVRGGVLLHCDDPEGVHDIDQCIDISKPIFRPKSSEDLFGSQQQPSELHLSVKSSATSVASGMSSTSTLSQDSPQIHNGHSGSIMVRNPVSDSITGNQQSTERLKDNSAGDIAHLIVLQHGFAGSSFDMRHLQNALFTEGTSNMHVLSACGNDKNNEDCIEVAAERLVQEIVIYCKEKLPFLLIDSNKGKVSFIGHSMGGLVIRKALEHKSMIHILSKLQVYISLATPHLGTVFADSQLVSVGQWALSKLKKSTALKELGLQDNRNMEDCQVFKLSMNYVLGHFKRVVFVSSPKDMYVPRFSAAVRVNHYTKISDVKSNKILNTVKKMADNILSKIDPDRLVRVTIDNNVGAKEDINSMIGRTAHICYLDNSVVATQLVLTLLPFLTS